MLGPKQLHVQAFNATSKTPMLAIDLPNPHVTRYSITLLIVALCHTKTCHYASITCRIQCVCFTYMYGEILTTIFVTYTPAI